MDVSNLRGRRATDRWNRVSMGDLFERVRSADPERIVLTAWDGAFESESRRHVRAAQADDLANRYAQALIAQRIEPGSVVMMICENSAEALLAKIGMAKAAVTVAPVNPNLGDDIIEALVALCKPAALVADSELMEKARRIARSTGRPLLHQIAIGGREADLPDFEGFIAGQPGTEPDIAIHGDDIWQLLFTSGSTAIPKAVMVSHINTMFAAMSFTGMGMVGVPFESEFRMGSFLPIIYHVGDSIMYNAVMAGGRLVLGRRFNARQSAEAIDREKITCLWGGAPHAIDAVCTEFEKDPSLRATSVRAVVFGWAPMSPALHEKTRRVLGEQSRCVEIIGQTEVVCCHRLWLDQHLALHRRTAPKENYVGLPHGLLSSKIMDAEDRAIEAGDARVGEGTYRSPALMAGYYRKPEDTAQAFRGGWFHGGDAFRWGEDHQRILADRFKDIIKTGGESVTTIRVEAVINLHPDVQKTAVVGLPHPRWGEAVTAFVIVKPGSSPAPEALIAFARERLSNFEVPKKVVLVSALPETVGGKVQKHVLRQQHGALYEGV